MKSYNRYILFFLLSFSFVSVSMCSASPSKKTEQGCCAEKMKVLRTALIDLIKTCDSYVEYWENQNNADKTLTYLKKQKEVYTIALGKLSKAEAYKKRSTQVLDEIIEHLSVPVYKKRQVALLDNLKPPSHLKRYRYRYGVAVGIAGVIALLAYRYRMQLEQIADSGKKVVHSNIVKPLVDLKDCLFGKSGNEAVERSKKEYASQKRILLSKVKDFVAEVNPGRDKQEIKKIVASSADQDIEGFVFDCLQRSKKSGGIHVDEKKSWVEWFLGCKLEDLLGMSPKAKLLEVEIKALLTRRDATKMLIDANEAMELNKLTIVSVSMVPIILAVTLSYFAGKKIVSWVSPWNEKKNLVKSAIRDLLHVLQQSRGKELSDKDQGLLSVFVDRLRENREVVPTDAREDFEHDLTRIESFGYSIDEKINIIKCMRLSLYAA